MTYSSLGGSGNGELERTSQCKFHRQELAHIKCSLSFLLLNSVVTLSSASLLVDNLSFFCLETLLAFDGVRDFARVVEDFVAHGSLRGMLDDSNHVELYSK